MSLKRFLSFAGVGVVGFLVDSGLLLAIISLTGVSPIVARFPSFILAATVTWLLNGRLTFGGQPKGWNSWAKYISVNSLGFLLNYLVYAGLVWFVSMHPFIAVAIASVIALAVNYLSTSLFVFGGRR